MQTIIHFIKLNTYLFYLFMFPKTFGKLTTKDNEFDTFFFTYSPYFALDLTVITGILEQ